MNPGRWYSARQIRESYLPGLSRSELYRLLESGAIQACRLGRKWLISESAIQTFIDVHLQPNFPSEQRDRRKRGALARSPLPLGRTDQSIRSMSSASRRFKGGLSR